MDEKSDGFASESNAPEPSVALASAPDDAQDPSSTNNGDSTDYLVSDIEYEEAMRQYDRKMERFWWKINLTRIGYLLAGVFIIVAAILFYVMGIGSLIKSMTDMQGTLSESDEVLNRSIFVADTYIASSSELRTARSQFHGDVNSFCPTVADHVNLTSVDSTVGESLGAEVEAEIKKLLEGVLDGIAGFSTSLEESAADMRSDLANVKSSVKSLNESLNLAYPFLYAAIAVTVVLIIIVLCLMASVIMAWRRRKAKRCFVKCMRNGIILPIFVIFMLLAWLFATMFLFIAIGGSDYCVSPDQNTAALLDLIHKGEVAAHENDDLVYTLLKFYVSGVAIITLFPSRPTLRTSSKLSRR